MAARLRETMSELSQLNRNLEGEVQRRTRQIRLAYAFTSVLNSPIDRRGDAWTPRISVMLEQALEALVEAPGARAAACSCPMTSTGPVSGPRGLWGLAAYPRAAAIAEGLPRSGGPPTARHSASCGGRGRRPRLLVPLVFRHQPLGLWSSSSALARSSGPLAGRLRAPGGGAAGGPGHNARAYARVRSLAHELTRATRPCRRSAIRSSPSATRCRRSCVHQREEQTDQLSTRASSCASSATSCTRSTA